MDFLRRHLFFIICGLVGAGGIVLGFTSFSAMPNVMKEMEKAQRIHRELQSLQSSPVDLRRLELEESRIREIREDYLAVRTMAEKVNRYQQLIEGFFPGKKRETDSGEEHVLELDKEVKFQEQYVAELRALVEMLNPILESGKRAGVAGAADFEFWSDQIKLEQEQNTRELRGVDDEASPEVPLSTGPPYSKGMVLTLEGARVDKYARAHMTRAQSIYCYVNDFRSSDEKDRELVPSLEFEPSVERTGTMERPDPETLWRAQLGLWIQGDVVRAIARMNEQAAEQYRKSLKDTEGRRTPPWVGIMPVKELISIRLSDYVTEESDQPVYGHDAGGDKDALPAGSYITVFTGTRSTDLYDTVQFSVKLVMDQRDIPRLVDEITKDRFHTLLRLSYEAVPVNHTMRGKIYGSDPTVQAVLDFETIFHAEPYRRWMPDVVLEALGVARPASEEKEEEG